MAILVRETNRCTIRLDDTGAEVLIIQRWQYVWTVRPPLPGWTPTERQTFQVRAEEAIRASWSNHARVKAAGTSEFAKKLNGTEIPIRIDIVQVAAKPHWTVSVQKVPADAFVTSAVVWNNRTITLDTNDLKWRNAANGEPGMNQLPIAHEFGHAFGNTSVLGRGDEYRADSPYVADTASIINRGNALRGRHFTYIVDELNQMLPNTTFVVSSIA